MNSACLLTTFEIILGCHVLRSEKANMWKEKCHIGGTGTYSLQQHCLGTPSGGVHVRIVSSRTKYYQRVATGQQWGGAYKSVVDDAFNVHWLCGLFTSKSGRRPFILRKVVNAPAPWGAGKRFFRCTKCIILVFLCALLDILKNIRCDKRLLFGGSTQ